MDWNWYVWNWNLWSWIFWRNIEIGNFGGNLTLECYLDIMVDSFEDCPTRLLRGQDIFGMRGFLTTYCDKKRGAVEISYRQFVYPHPSASKGEHRHFVCDRS
jgi:hypothetical protein